MRKKSIEKPQQMSEQRQTKTIIERNYKHDWLHDENSIYLFILSSRILFC